LGLILQVSFIPSKLQLGKFRQLDWAVVSLGHINQRTL